MLRHALAEALGAPELDIDSFGLEDAEGESEPTPGLRDAVALLNRETDEHGDALAVREATPEVDAHAVTLAQPLMLIVVLALAERLLADELEREILGLTDDDGVSVPLTLSDRDTAAVREVDGEPDEVLLTATDRETDGDRVSATDSVENSESEGDADGDGEADGDLETRDEGDGEPLCVDCLDDEAHAVEEPQADATPLPLAPASDSLGDALVDPLSDTVALVLSDTAASVVLAVRLTEGPDDNEADGLVDTAAVLVTETCAETDTAGVTLSDGDEEIDVERLGEGVPERETTTTVREARPVVEPETLTVTEPLLFAVAVAHTLTVTEIAGVLLTSALRDGEPLFVGDADGRVDADGVFDTMTENVETGLAVSRTADAVELTDGERPIPYVVEAVMETLRDTALLPETLDDRNGLLEREEHAEGLTDRAADLE